MNWVEKDTHCVLSTYILLWVRKQNILAIISFFFIVSFTFWILYTETDTIMKYSSFLTLLKKNNQNITACEHFYGSEFWN